jgi:hypothetical protein
VALQSQMDPPRPSFGVEARLLTKGTAEQVRAQARQVIDLLELIERDKALVGSDRRPRDHL